MQSIIPQSSPHKILCVDDEKPVLNSISRELQDLGAVLYFADSAEQAYEKIATNTYSVVISDLRLPGADGITLLKTLAKQAPDTVKILLSGKLDIQSTIQAINHADLFSFATKPWKPGAIKDVVSKAIFRHDLLRTNRQFTMTLSQKCKSLGIRSIDLEKEVQSRTTSMLLGMVNALDLRDTETHWHSRRVALFARKLAEILELDVAMILEVERGALLHDVGKIGVSDTILLKPGKLTEEEWEEMRRHAQYGYQILENVQFLEDAKMLVWQHHERWDGNGYPLKISGKNIHIGARIFAIIDTYDAMTSDRPYRKALSHEIAIQEINKMSGTQFDPEVVNAWNTITEAELNELRELTYTPSSGIL